MCPQCGSGPRSRGLRVERRHQPRAALAPSQLGRGMPWVGTSREPAMGWEHHPWARSCTGLTALGREAEHAVRDAEHHAAGVDGLAGVGALVSLLHIPDDQCPAPLLARDGHSGEVGGWSECRGVLPMAPGTGPARPLHCNPLQICSHAANPPQSPSHTATLPSTAMSLHSPSTRQQ